MYAKITICNANDLKDTYEYLQMNNYSVERVENHLYVLEDELEFVETILSEHCIDYSVEDRNDIKRFYGDNEVIEYGKYKLDKYDWEKVKVNGDKVILCGTDLVYTDDFFNFANEMISKFSLEEDVEVAELRDAFQELFESITGYKFMDVYNEY